MNFKRRKKIIVAMSGGVDSSVAAALLKRTGFNLIGVFMKFWRDAGFSENRCCSSEAEKRARKVAKILKIPFYVFNFEKEFKKRIVNYFLKEHKKGLTPNPCVVCNKEIKFGLLLKKALALDADFVATGHYARIKSSANSEYITNKRINKFENSRLIRYSLIKSKDKEKDQSYFLWMLNQKQLKRILFPIGDYTRSEVEKLAKKFRLPVLSARKSVEICFIKSTVNDFLKKYLKENPGKIITREGKIIGKHQGLWFYTIGQRKGIKLPSGPYYVIAKDFKKNLLIVSKNEKDLAKKELVAKNVNWILGKMPRLPLKIKAKIRYRHEAVPAIITKNLKPTTKRNQRFLTGQGIYKLKFTKLQRAITPGQSVVFYRGDELLGGGIIER
jgi:tRNA-specific 2-thiouridylase